MTIHFQCPECGKLFLVRNESAGRKGRCVCGAVLLVPTGVEGEKIEISCSVCHRQIKVPLSDAGKKGLCPQCKNLIIVPQAGVPAPMEDRPDAPTAAMVICPSCNRKLDENATVCVHCGIYIRSGRPILTARGTDEDILYEHARAIVRPLSFLIPFGIYPVYSEVMGRHRPYATWAIAALTVLISAWFLYYEYADSPKMRSMKNLMLWVGDVRPDAERIQSFYEHTNYGDAKAFEAAKKKLKTTTPKNELDYAAMKHLRPEAQCFGQYRHTQLITHAFLHGGPLHLVGNMLFLLIFGSRVSSVIGNIWSLILYVLLAIAAGFTHLVMSGAQMPTALLGASGAVMGMAGVYLVLFPMHKIFMTVWWRPFGVFHLSFNIFAVWGVCVVFFYIFFDIIAVSFAFKSHTAHWAHIGGLLWGMLAGLILLVSRAAYSKSDALSLIFGKHCWWLIGRPCNRG